MSANKTRHNEAILQSFAQSDDVNIQWKIYQALLADNKEDKFTETAIANIKNNVDKSLCRFFTRPKYFYTSQK